MQCIAASQGTPIINATVDQRVQLANFIIKKTGTKFSSRDEAIGVCGVAFDELTSSFPMCTIEELALSYDYAAKGEFYEGDNRYKLFREVSAPQMREVYLMWIDFKRKSLSEAIKNQSLYVEPTKQEKSSQEIVNEIETELERAKSIVKGGGYYSGIGARILYDYLRNRTKQLVVKSEDLETIWNESCRKYLGEKRETIPMFDTIQNQLFLEIKQKVESAEIGKHAGVLNIVKEELLNKWLNENQ